jgi:hypothetical protein
MNAPFREVSAVERIYRNTSVNRRHDKNSNLLYDETRARMHILYQMHKTFNHFYKALMLSQLDVNKGCRSNVNIRVTHAV